MSEQEQETEAGAGMATAEVATVKELILKAYPDVVPELVTGATVGELTASVEAARAAFASVVSRQAEIAAATPGTPVVPVAPSAPSAPVAPAVPAGGATVVIDPANLPTAEKIRRGLIGRNR